MSKLTNCQIKALIPRMERTLADAIRRGHHTGILGRVRRRIAAYKGELKQRENAGLNPGTEIQESHNK